MKKATLLLAIIFGSLLFVSAAEPIRVACVGNSITYGSGVENRDINSYPAQLQKQLGDTYKVENFGVSATTLLSNGNYPYITTDQYKASLAFLPNIVLIKLGTNDSKSFNRDKLAENYIKDYQKLIDSYRSLPSKPRVILMQPVACYQTQGDFKGANQIYESSIIPMIEKLAFDNSLEVIDLYHVFGETIDPALMPDLLHPSARGVLMMVDRMIPVIVNTTPAANIAKKVAPKKAATINFHGYKGFQWDNGYKIVEPRHSAVGNPWVIRARFWGHEPQTDIALLERGFHIAYCPVEDLFGSPEAVKRYDDFYAKMVKAGFSPKVVLEGMSRGGLIVYNWAARNADKVAAIYADAPVMDIKSWPMKSSEGDTKNMMKAYGFNSIDQAKAWKGNPVDHARALVGIPIIHVVGQADDVVPVADNTDVFKDSLQNAGGFMTVIRKPGVGHHPHSLQAPSTIVDFILVATAQVANKCAVAQVGQEWRSGAGWNNGADWWAVSQEINQVTQRPCEVLLLGNSITQGFSGYNRKLINRSEACNIMMGALKRSMGRPISWECAGISGDRTEHLLWRVKNGNYNATGAKHVFITIGVNNLTPGDDPANVALAIQTIAQEVSAQFPWAKITVFGPLPYYNLEKSKATHDTLATLKFPSNVQYVNPWDWFVDENGNQRTQYYGGDKLHLSTKGYVMWSEKIAEICAKNSK